METKNNPEKTSKNGKKMTNFVVRGSASFPENQKLSIFDSFLTRFLAPILEPKTY